MPSHNGCTERRDGWRRWRSDASFERTVTSVLPIAGIDACGTEYTDLADPPEDAVRYALSLFYKGKTSGVVVTVAEAAP